MHDIVYASHSHKVYSIPSVSDTQKNITVSVALTTIGSVLLLLGAILFILVLTLIIVYKLHHRKGTHKQSYY